MNTCVYLNDINSIKKILIMINEEKNLTNYLEQLSCARKSEFLNSEHYSHLVHTKYNLSMDEIRQKLKFKLNQSINKCLEKLDCLMSEFKKKFNCKNI